MNNRDDDPPANIFPIGQDAPRAIADELRRYYKTLVDQELPDAFSRGEHALATTAHQLGVPDADADQLAVGQSEFSEDAHGVEVLTLEEAAALLRLPVETLHAKVLAGDLPGRAFGDEWRFSRSALLAWLVFRH